MHKILIRQIVIETGRKRNYEMDLREELRGRIKQSNHELIVGLRQGRWTARDGWRQRLKADLRNRGSDVMVCATRDAVVDSSLVVGAFVFNGPSHQASCEEKRHHRYQGSTSCYVTHL